MTDQPVVDPQDAEKNRLQGIIAYIPFLFVVPLLVAPQSKFSKFHANQGLLLSIVSVALWIIIQKIINGIIVRTVYSSSLTNIFSVATRGSFVATLVSIVVWGIISILALIGVIGANKGECKPLPIIGKYKLLK